jgi:hypothetical protein
MAKFEIAFTLSKFQNQCMALAVLANDQPVLVEHNTIILDCALPAKIKFLVSGKGKFDTELDDQGNIVADKFVRIDRVSIDRMPVPLYLLESRLIKFVPDNPAHATSMTNYLAWNGQAELSVDSGTSFEFFLDLHSD